MRVSEQNSFLRKKLWFFALLFALHPLVAMADTHTLNIGNTRLILRTTCDAEHKLWFQIGNEKLCIPMTTEYATNTLHVEDNGVIYSAGRLELFYEATAFNSCESVSLPRGRYCVDLLGGSGGDGGNNSGSGLVSTDEKSKCFEISETTTASVFRGGDGNSGSVNNNGNVYSGGGGGASGVPSLIAFGNTVLVSPGGAGGMGGTARDYSGDDGRCGAGGGGNAAGGGNGLTGKANAELGDGLFICGGGGGGAVSGSGGARATDRLILSSYTAAAGSAAGANGGGAGGAAQRNSSSKNGGTGGNNTTYTCVGTSLVSYGGGGGGGVGTRYLSAVDLKGGNGGSGSTGTSSSSYVRIYRFE